MVNPFRSRRVVLAAVLSLGLLSPLTVFAQESPESPEGILVPKGPLPHRDSEPLNTPFLLPLPTDARILSPGRARLGVRLDIVNNLLNDTKGSQIYLTDFEEQRLYLNYARGIGHGQEVGIQVGYITRNGGILDTLVNNWHSLLGLKGGGRGSLPDYRTLFRVNNAAGQTIINSTQKENGFGDTVLEYRRALTTVPDPEQRTRALAASARALVKLPTGSRSSLLGSGATDVGFGVAVSARPDRRLAIHSNATLVLLGKPRIPNLETRRSLLHSMVALEYLWTGRTSLVVQTDDNPSPFRSGLSYPDRPRRGFTGGVWREINDATRLHLSITENDFGPLAKHAPDFTLSLGAQWRM